MRGLIFAAMLAAAVGAAPIGASAAGIDIPADAGTRLEALEDLTALADGKIIVGNNGTGTAVSVSGDVALGNDGKVTVEPAAGITTNQVITDGATYTVTLYIAHGIITNCP